MSLVYDALSRGNGERAIAATLPPQAATRIGPWLSRHRTPALWLLAGALAAGPAGLLLAPRIGTPARVDAQAPAAAASPLAEVAAAASEPVPEQSEPAPMPAPPAAPLQDAAAQGDTPATTAEAGIDPAAPTMPPAAPAAAAGPAAVARAEPAPMSAPAAPVPAPAPAPSAGTVEVQVSRAQTQMSVRSREEAAREDASDEARTTAVRGAMTSLYAAVADGDLEQADQAVAQLQSLLPAQSLTLLRARAWRAHGAGDFAQAESLYRQILERVPDDEHAGVNLALLEARMGELSQARSRLDRLAARNKRSPQIAQALAELDAAQR